MAREATWVEPVNGCSSSKPSGSSKREKRDTMGYAQYCGRRNRNLEPLRPVATRITYWHMAMILRRVFYFSTAGTLFRVGSRKVGITRLTFMMNPLAIKPSTIHTHPLSIEPSTSILLSATSLSPHEFDLDTDSRLPPVSSLCVVSISHSGSAFTLTNLSADMPQPHEMG